MFMSPQHLQAQDAYHESLLSARLAALTPYDWGVVAVELDREALGRGDLSLRRFLGVLPSGLVLSFEEGSREAPPARPVEAAFDPKLRSLDVFLAVPREREGVALYERRGQASEVARYNVEGRPIADLLNEAAPISVEFARPKVTLLLGSEPREDFETLKIAELARDAAGALVMVEAYIPPCLRVDASPYLMDGLRRLLRMVAAKQRELADSRRFRDASALEFTASDVTRYLQLSALNGTLPFLQHALEAGNLSPQQVYLQLIQSAGALATFGVETDLGSLPPFQHTQLRATFEPLFERLGRLLKSVAVEQCIPVQLEARPGGMYWGRLDDERFARCPQFILSVRSELPEQQVVEQLPRLAKIASKTELTTLLRAATPGVPIQVTFRPPPEVPVKPGVVYFSLGLEDAYWKRAIQEQNVAVYLPQTFDPGRTQLELLGVPAAGPR
jgi:type VI secretion system protein ImpJ